MPNAIAEAQRTDVRDLILAAAETRFRRYGFSKTTMTEIAGDAGMSAANLYRYFDNKLDIASACCKRCMEERLDFVGRRVREADSEASAQLHELVVANVEFTHQLASNYHHLHELVETITGANQDLIHAENASMQALIGEILENGNAREELAVDDVANSARAVHTAIALFQLPTCMGLFTLEQFRVMAQDVVTVLVTGLSHGGVRSKDRELV